jgi:predicted nucleic acid-binding protein
MTAGLLDTSVIIDLDDPTVQAHLPEEISVCAISLAELAAGPILANTATERALRQKRLQQIESTFDSLPFDASAARSYAQVVAATIESGRKHRSRVADLFIASIAHSNDLDFYTRNPDDFTGLEELIRIIII